MNNLLRLILVLLAAVMLTEVTFAQSTYTWNQTGSAAWTTSSNWTPTRTTPAASDILVFNNGAATTITAVPTQTIGQLIVSSNTSVSLATSGSHTITIDGGTGTDLVVETGSSLNASAGTITVFLGVGATGSISGSMNWGSTNSRLDANDASAITFNSGAVFTQNVGGNVFTTSGTANVVIFSAGSVFVSQSGSNPFGLGQPDSKVVFQTGSLYRHEQSGTPAFSGRTYANFELNNAATISTNGTSPLSIDTILVSLGTLNIGMRGTFNLKGAISVASGATLNFNPSSSATVNFSGSSLQSISGLGTCTFQTNQNINVNGSGIALGKSLSFNGNLIFTAGSILLGDNDLSVIGTITGADASKFFVTNGTGSVLHPIAGGANFLYPLSTDGSDYNPLTIALNPIDPTETFSVRVAAAVSPSAPDNQTAVQRTWTISEATPGGNNASLTFQWSGSQEGTNFSRGAAAAWRHDGSDWVQASVGTTSGADPYSLTTATTITAFSPFLVGNQGSLPITLSSFAGSIITGGSVRLEWSTISEINNYGFEVERAALPSGSYTTVSTLIPGHGTTNVPQNYAFTDPSPLGGTSFYRLKQIDLDHSIHISESVTINSGTAAPVAAPKVFALSQNFPNPFNPKSDIRFTVERDGRATLRLYNAIGQEVATIFDGWAEAGKYYQAGIDGTKLSSGIYFYRLESSGRSGMRKTVLLK